METVVRQRCGRKLKNKKSIKKGYGPTCEQKLLQDFYKKRQITIDDILKGKESVENERQYEKK